MSGCVKAFDETKLMSFSITENDVLEKYGYIWRKI